MDKDYYNYYEFLFSLRKEYLENQKIINKLMSYIRITGKPIDEYNSNLLFKPNIDNDIDSLLLIVKKRESCIRLFLDSLYSSLVSGESNSKSSNFSFAFRLSKEYVYLLDNDQDGRYLNAKVEITDQKEFIELYKELIEKAICKGKTCLFFDDGFIQLTNNGINLFQAESDYKKNYKLDYNGIEDLVITNNVSKIDNLMHLKVNKKMVPEKFKKLVDRNMDFYSYSVEKGNNKNKELYTIEDQGKKLILRPNKL